jgi:hypothetical protein
MPEEIKENTATCTYSVILKLLYRYGNVIVTIFLSLYLLPIVVNLDQKLILIIPLLLILFLIYYVNKYYFTLYKIMPFKIEFDDEKMICTKFILGMKKFDVYYEDINKLEGGVFENKMSGIMKVYDGKNSVIIGFYPKMRNSNKLITMILSKVKKEIYDEVMERLLKKKNSK